MDNMDEDIKIRFATFEDAEQVIKLSEEYIRQTPWSKRLQFDPEIMVRTIAEAIETEMCIIALHGERVVAFGLLATCQWAFKSGDIGMEVYYVTPEYRGTVVTRAMHYGFLEIIKKRGIAIGWAVSTSMMGDETTKSYSNTLEKLGFEACGPTYTFINPDCEEAIKDGR